MSGIDRGAGTATGGGDAPGPSRLAAAREALKDAGIAAPVRATGIDGEIAAITGRPALRERLAEVAPALRAIGFQYIALDLDNRRGTDIQDK